MRGRWLLVSGILAPAIYVITVLAGAAATPGYRHVRNTISELVAIDAVQKPVLDPILMLSCLLGIAYAVGLIAAWRRIALPLVPAALGVVLVAATGFAILWFPVDGRPLPRPPLEHVHIVLTGLVLLLMTATLFLFARGSRNVPGWDGLSRYAAATLVVVFGAGVLTAIGEPNDWPILGLVERFAIGPYLLWMAVTAIATIRLDARSNAELDPAAKREPDRAVPGSP